MAITRLNHAVLYVRDVDVSKAFYTEVLGFSIVVEIPGGAFFRAPGSTNDHDLATFQIGSAAGPSTAGTATVGLYHLAWEVDTLGELERLRSVLREAGALVGQTNHGTTKSLYAKDPDGIELEIVWLVPAALLDAATVLGTAPLDLEAEIERYGPTTVGGVGISH